MSSRVARRIVLALLLAAMVPLGAAAFLSLGLTEVSLGLGLNDTVRKGLTNDLPLYGALFEAKKAYYQSAASALVADGDLPALIHEARRGELEDLLLGWMLLHPDLARVRLQTDLLDVEVGREIQAGSRPLALRRSLLPPARGQLELEFRLPSVYQKGLDESRQLAERYQALAGAREVITRRLVLSFVTVLAVVLIGAVLVGLLLARSVTRRVEELALATARVAHGDLEARVAVTGSDEISLLGHSFNTMVSELAQNRDRIVYLEKISGWQDVARRLAHEIKNPLTPITLAMQQLDEKKPRADSGYCALVTTAREIVEEEVGALRHLVEEFSAFARLPEVRPEPVPFSPYLEEILRQLAATTDADIQWGIEADPTLMAIDRVLMRRVLVNVVTNAIEAQTGERPVVRVHTRKVDGARLIEIEDAGPGVSNEGRARLFEPYFTTKKNGTGLGLSIVKKIVLQHGGTIDVDTSPALSGARFTLHLPVAVAGPAGRVSR